MSEPSASWRHLWVPLTADNQSGWVNTMDQVSAVMKAYEAATATRFVVYKRMRKDFGAHRDQVLKPNMRVRFRDIAVNKSANQEGAPPTVPYDGTPFAILGKQVMCCHLGPDKHRNHKEKVRRKIQQELEQGGQPPKRRKSRTKKINCPAQIMIKEVVCFPDYKVSKDGELQMRRQSEALRDALERGRSVRAEHRLYIRFPRAGEHVHGDSRHAKKNNQQVEDHEYLPHVDDDDIPYIGEIELDTMSTKPTILVHGGAWAIPEVLVEASRLGVKNAVRTGYSVLLNGGSAVDAVEAAVTVLEDDPAFDAGTGSVLTSAGTVEMDAVIMDGRDLNAGAVACVQNIANPVKLARMVMEKTEHTMMVGPGANAFAKEMRIKETPTMDLITEAAKKEFEEYQKFKTAVKKSFKARDPVPVSGHDTVGAVAVDLDGNVAFATSTGGITAKRPGRVGDSPLIGCGGYADNAVGAVSTTGHGESITKVCLAHHIIGQMKQGSTAQEAAEKSLAYMSERVHGSGGVIVVSNTGDIGIHYSTTKMAWASLKDNVLRWGVNESDNFEENISIQAVNGVAPVATAKHS